MTTHIYYVSLALAGTTQIGEVARDEMNEVIIKLFTWLIEKYIRRSSSACWRKIISDYCCVTVNCFS